MSYPQQPGNWNDPSWPSQTPAQPGYDPKSGGYDPAAGYPASGYPGTGYPAYGYPAPVAKTNGMAIASLVCSIVGIGSCITAPVGAVLGHVARRQIRERGESGDGMALAGIIIGWIGTVLLLGLIAFWVFAIVLAANSPGGLDGTSTTNMITAWLTAAAG